MQLFEKLQNTGQTIEIYDSIYQIFSTDVMPLETMTIIYGGIYLHTIKSTWDAHILTIKIIIFAFRNYCMGLYSLLETIVWVYQPLNVL